MRCRGMSGEKGWVAALLVSIEAMLLMDKILHWLVPVGRCTVGSKAISLFCHDCTGFHRPKWRRILSIRTATCISVVFPVKVILLTWTVLVPAVKLHMCGHSREISDTSQRGKEATADKIWITHAGVADDASIESSRGSHIPSASKKHRFILDDSVIFLSRTICQSLKPFGMHGIQQPTKVL